MPPLPIGLPGSSVDHPRRRLTPDESGWRYRELAVWCLYRYHPTGREGQCDVGELRDL